MISTHGKPERWRPRFSVRTLVILLTLVCLYFGSWEITKTRGTQEVSRRFKHPQLVRARAVAPLLVAVDEEQASHDLMADGSSAFWTQGHRSYYFWFAGHVIQLPYERDIPPNTSLVTSFAPRRRRPR